MKRLTIAIGLFVLVGGGRSAIAAELDGFFACAEIVFFGSCPTTVPAASPQRYIKEAPDQAEPAQRTVSPPSSSKPQLEESIWAEPLRGPDGQLRVYLPPRAVRDFLERPTPENAREYLAWNESRMRQVDEAVKIMRDVAAQQFGIPTKEAIAVPVDQSALNAEMGDKASHLPPQAFPLPSSLATTRTHGQARSETAARQISIAYAFAAWCPYSRQQTPIINQLAGQVPVRGVVFDSKPEELEALRPALAFPITQGDVDLRQRLGVRSYPTIFFFEGSRLRHVARGLQSPDGLLSVLTALASRQLPPGPNPGSESAADTCQLRS